MWIHTFLKYFIRSELFFFINFNQMKNLIHSVALFSSFSLPNENRKIQKVQIRTEMFLMRNLLKKKSWQLLRLKDPNEFQIVPLSTQAWETFTSNFFLLSMYCFYCLEHLCRCVYLKKWCNLKFLLFWLKFWSTEMFDSQPWGSW